MSASESWKSKKEDIYEADATSQTFTTSIQWQRPSPQLDTLNFCLQALACIRVASRAPQ